MSTEAVKREVKPTALEHSPYTDAESGGTTKGTRKDEFVRWEENVRLLVG